MIPFTMLELAEFCSQDKLLLLSEQAHSAARQNIEAVSTSTQNITEHCLFVPLKGERFDAHIFIKEALQANVSALVLAQSVEEVLRTIKEKCQSTQEYESLQAKLYSLPILQCADTQRALGLCGMFNRLRCDTLVAAITGSCGKTTVKEMTAAIMNAHSHNRCLFTEGNFNNDVGVPLTLLRFDNNIDYAVVEQGASHLQDIARTAEFVKADLALITNVGEAHIEGFGSAEGVYHGKSEILDVLFANHQQESCKNEGMVGFAVVPADSPWYSKWCSDYAQYLEQGRLLSFGESAQASMQVSDIQESAQSISFTLTCHEERLQKRFQQGRFTLNMLGRHNAINFAGASLLALLMGANEQDIVDSVQNLSAKGGRLNLQVFAERKFALIDDAYNASYNSVIAAIDTLSKQKGYRIFAFGQMGELGNAAIELHRKVGAYAYGKIDSLICYGELSKHTVQAWQEQAQKDDSASARADACTYVTSHDEAVLMIEKAISLNEFTTCLVKGSHSSHMEKVVAALKGTAQ